MTNYMRTQPSLLLAISSAFAVVYVSAVLPAAAEDNWSRFRGADGLGVGTGATIPTKFGDSENLKWKTKLPGAGSSSPIVWGNRVFLTSYSRDGGALQRQIVCIDRDNGSIVWTRTVDSERSDDPYSGFLREHGYASNTPVTDGERLFVFLGKSGVHAFSMDGKPLWQVDVGNESNPRQWGSGASLILYKDKVIVNATEESRSIRALNKATGEQVWIVQQNALDLCYNTPTIGKSESGRDELIVPVPDEVWSLNPDTGKLRWYAATPCDSNVSPSAIVKDGIAYLYGGRGGGATAVRLGGRGDVTETHVLWSERDSSYVATPLLHAGHLFWASDRGQAYCVDATSGETVHRARLRVSSGGRPFYASPVLSGDKLIIPSRYDGIFVFAATPEMEQLAVNKFAGDDSQFNATPAVVDGQMFLRSDAYLYCIMSE